MIKDTNLTIRMSKEHKEMIMKEAHKLGMSASNFILMSCIKEINLTGATITKTWKKDLREI